MLTEDIKCYEDFLNGDLQGFEQLVLKYKDHLIYFIYRYTKDINLAEDLAQDAFVEILVHKERYNMTTNFKTYLFTIGRNKAVDAIRKQSRLQTIHAETEVCSEVRSLEEHVIQKETQTMLYEAMGSLKKEYQIVLHLIDLEELSYLEAARIMDRSLPQIKVLIHRARKSLAKVLNGKGLTR